MTEIFILSLANWRNGYTGSLLAMPLQAVAVCIQHRGGNCRPSVVRGDQPPAGTPHLRQAISVCQQGGERLFEANDVGRHDEPGPRWFDLRKMAARGDQDSRAVSKCLEDRHREALGIGGKA